MPWLSVNNAALRDPKEEVMAVSHNDESILSGIASSVTQLSHLFVRMIGVLLLLVGLWVSLRVIDEAWDLYKAPERIDRFAKAIDRGSNIDKIFVSGNFRESASDPDKESTEKRIRDAFRPSYFVAWGVVLLLLMLIGRLALMAVKTGGELTLYDSQVKKLVRTLLQETGKSPPLQRKEPVFTAHPGATPGPRLGEIRSSHHSGQAPV